MRVGLASVEVNSLRNVLQEPLLHSLLFMGHYASFFILFYYLSANIIFFFKSHPPFIFFYLLSVRSVDLKKQKQKKQNFFFIDETNLVFQNKMSESVLSPN